MKNRKNKSKNESSAVSFCGKDEREDDVFLQKAVI